MFANPGFKKWPAFCKSVFNIFFININKHFEMKKLITSGLLLVGSLCVTLSANAQNAVEKGKVLVDLYYGAPNFGKKLAAGIDEINVSTSNVRGIGPLGLRAEYMLADKFGLGIDVIYNTTGTDVTYDSLNNDGSLYRTYNGELNMNRLRVQLRFNYHFVSTENLDVYTGVGAGSNSRFWKVKSTDPEFNNDWISTGSRTILPVSMRLAVGMRYYFTPNIGLNAEIGIGGPLVSAGVSFKF